MYQNIHNIFKVLPLEMFKDRNSVGRTPLIGLAPMGIHKDLDINTEFDATGRLPEESIFHYKAG